MLIFLCAARLRKDRQKFLTALFHSSYANIRRRCGRDFIFSRQPWKRQGFSLECARFDSFLRRFEFLDMFAWADLIRKQSVVNIDIDYRERDGKSKKLKYHVEIRWSHGKFCGNPEAKLYKHFLWKDAPGFKILPWLFWLKFFPAACPTPFRIRRSVSSFSPSRRAASRGSSFFPLFFPCLLVCLQRSEGSINFFQKKLAAIQLNCFAHDLLHLAPGLSRKTLQDLRWLYILYRLYHLPLNVYHKTLDFAGFNIKQRHPA